MSQKKRVLDMELYEKTMNDRVKIMTDAMKRCSDKGDVSGQERWLIRIEQAKDALFIARSLETVLK